MIRDQEDVDVEGLFSHVKDISSLAHFARCQAQEAEMRANYALNLAERAAMEADAVRHVAESLTKTARSVAKMSLEHISKMNSAEYRSFKRGEILAAVRSNCDRKLTPEQPKNANASPQRRRHMTSNAARREALSEETIVHTPLTDHKTLSPEDRPDISPDTTVRDAAREYEAPPSNSGSDFLDTSDLLLCVESLHRQSSQFTETFPDTEEVKSDIVKDFDSTEKLPIVWEDTYQGQGGRRPMPWSDKKSIRKIQRKLRDLEVTEEAKGSEVDDDAQEDPEEAHGDPCELSNDESETR